MKKSAAAATASLLLCAVASAYNPPAGGQNVLRISSPELLTGAHSAAGGPLFKVAPDSVVNNPALPGFNQRSSLELAGTLLFDGDDASDKSLGGAAEFGTILANRWCVPTILVQGVFVPYYDMHLGNSVNLTLGYAKDITENLAVGMSANVGLLWGYGSDWSASAGLGMLYNFGDVGFLKNARLGISLMNLGKMYSDTEVYGIDADEDAASEEDLYADSWPGVATPRIGVAASLLEAKNFAAGVSADVSAPGFQNFVADAGLQILLFEHVKIASAWEFDLREYKNDAKNVLPSVGISFNIRIKPKKWQESEITAGAAWQRLYENVDAVSAGLIMDLGLEDDQPPEIIMW